MRILITGGAGFIGCNIADAFASAGDEIIVADNLARAGSRENLFWLRNCHPSLRFAEVDVRDQRHVLDCVRAAGPLDGVIHLASQVAVTTSVQDPRLDFEVNLAGTFNVLEAVRASGGNPVVVYASTNKVYGNLERLRVVERDGRYAFADRPQGIAEDEPLDFHSPYGCSKGAADQYVHDYARIYGLRTVVLRQSCIYGRHQYGLEDQGWLAWFARAALTGKPITIYGDGRQVRDVLFIDDLVRAYRVALTRPAAWGEVFNIGGGPRHTLSVWAEFGAALEGLIGRPIPVTYADWRPGDQRVFICDIRKAERVLGWRPDVDWREGIAALLDWTRESLRGGTFAERVTSGPNGALPTVGRPKR
ncbi:MAG TPA: SDR family NAD(P)-dependent oxidoreductase [Dehalococcoidia bacterium]|nr:SDR family NAD(P)-dependent oxidoreductase [Dehalococcoidia bacterium]